MTVGVRESHRPAAALASAAASDIVRGQRHDFKPADSVAAAPSPEPGPVQQRRDLRSMDELLDAFLANDIGEALDAPAAAWGPKVGMTIFDEEDILGLYDRKLDRLIRRGGGGMSSPAGTTPGRSVGGETLSSDEEEDDSADEDDSDVDGGVDWYMDDEEWEEQEAYYDGNTAFVPRDRGIYTREDDAVPRAAHRLQPFSRVYELDRGSPVDCPICLEALEVGQKAWRLPCTHLLHEVCALRFLRSRRSKSRCPLCRCELKVVGVATFMASCCCPMAGVAV